MKITVLGGSPKGTKSVTMQYIRFLELQYPEVEFEVLQPAFRIRRLELNSELFDKMVETVRLSDAVLWAFPLYVHSVCSQYLRF
ncbi:MAG: NAD(P)H dehydrogenase, partial [Spirochaetes bacterium]